MTKNTSETPKIVLGEVKALKAPNDQTIGSGYSLTRSSDSSSLQTPNNFLQSKEHTPVKPRLEVTKVPKKMLPRVDIKFTPEEIEQNSEKYTVSIKT